jgi:integrase
MTSTKRPQNQRYYDEGESLHFSPEQTKSFFRAAREYDKDSVRLLAMFTLAYMHALRASEVARFKVSDIDWENGALFVHRLKGSKNGHQPWFEAYGLNEKEILNAWKQERDAKFGTDTDALFPSRETNEDGTRFLNRSQVYRLFEDVCRLADSTARKEGNSAGRISRAYRHVHILKHARLRHLGQDPNISLDDLQAFSGHKNVQSLLIYTRKTAAESIKNIAAASKALA